MSVLFPKVNKPREWDYRPIYYDEEKEARKAKLARLRALREQAESEQKSEVSGQQSAVSDDEYVTKLHRGSFREAHEAQTKLHTDTQHKSKLGFWIALLAMLLFCFYFLL